MSDETSARLSLPLLQPGQAQKELFHNAALTVLDLLVQPVVQAVGIDAPPDDPARGAAWIVGSEPTGAWAGQAGNLAGWTDGGWTFIVPAEGFAVWSVADETIARRVGPAWQVGTLSGATLVLGGDAVVGPRRPAIAAPAGGVTIDTEARNVLAAVLEALRGHGLIAT